MHQRNPQARPYGFKSIPQQKIISVTSISGYNVKCIFVSALLSENRRFLHRSLELSYEQKNKRQRGLIYTEYKPFCRLCKMRNPFFNEFKLVMSINAFKLVFCTSTIYTPKKLKARGLTLIGVLISLARGKLQKKIAKNQPNSLFVSVAHEVSTFLIHIKNYPYFYI